MVTGLLPCRYTTFRINDPAVEDDLETDTMSDIDEDDERVIELSTLQATFPELVFDKKKPLKSTLTATLELPVVPSRPVPIIFRDISDNLPTDAQDDQHPIHHLDYLPNIRIGITLPKGYPAEKPPIFGLSTVTKWLPRSKISILLKQGVQLWEDMGHDQVVYLFIDQIQDAAQNVFGLLEGREYLQLPSDFEIEFLDHDKSAKQAEFDRQGHDCGICLEPKRGSACHKLDDCGHIFCRQCFQDFYNNAITEGDINSVKCLDPGCAKGRLEKLAQSGKKRKPKVILSANELLQIPLELEMVKRYVTMKHKIELENDKSTVYCPRNYCEGAARSKKHKKPILLPTHLSATPADETDEESDDESLLIDPTKPPNRADLLRICEDCGFAFCSRCLQTWHGEYVVCGSPRVTDELTAEDKASLDYIKYHTTPCPTCAVPAQKTHGCNHMNCQRCETHFCYLCSAWLDPHNPYQHYNTETTGCYQRLWELEGGDGNDVGYAFEGGDHPVSDEEMSDEGSDFGSDVESDDDDRNPGPRFAVQLAVPRPPDARAVGAAEADVDGPPVARVEAPLILRIDQIPPRPVAAPVIRQPHAHPPVPGRLGGRFARAAARRAAAPAPARQGQPAGGLPPPPPQPHLNPQLAGHPAIDADAMNLINPAVFLQAVELGVPIMELIEQAHLQAQAAPPEEQREANAAWAEHFAQLAVEDDAHD